MRITEDEALELYEHICASWENDPETAHCREDNLLVEALLSAGWTRLADAIVNNDAATRWYA